jgi:hypothetical protein
MRGETGWYRQRRHSCVVIVVLAFELVDGCSRVVRSNIGLRLKRKEPPPLGKRLLDVGTLVSPCYNVEATPSASSLGTPQICTSVMETRDRTGELPLSRHRIG